MIVGQFAGPGGWSVGAALLGLGPERGYEFDREACRTGRLAGFKRTQIDVAHVTDDELAALAPDCEGHITSPPCQAYSRAGSQQGKHDVERIAAHLAEVAATGRWHDYRDRDEAVPDLFGDYAIDHSRWADPRSALVLEAVRWQLALQPRWVVAEQVPDVLPFWQQWAEFLTDQGYSTWTGVLSAEQHGVPQTRKRAILIASRDREVHAPTPTHRRYNTRKGSGGNYPDDADLPQWISMGRALGVPAGDVGFPRRPDDRGPADESGEYRARDWRSTAEPSFALTEKARSWSRRVYRNGNQPNSAERPIDTPAPTIHFGHALNVRLFRWALRASFSDEGSAKPVPRDTDQPAPTITTKGGNYDWVQPATTIAGDPRVWPPGHKVNADDRRRLGQDEADDRYGDRAGTEAVKVTVPQAACLQSFPVGYPFVGSDTAKYRQIGDAVPPLLAVAVLGVAAGLEDEAATICTAAYGSDTLDL